MEWAKHSVLTESISFSRGLGLRSVGRTLKDTIKNLSLRSEKSGSTVTIKIFQSCLKENLRHYKVFSRSSRFRVVMG